MTGLLARLRAWWREVTTPPVTVLDSAQAPPFPLVDNEGAA